MLGFIANLAWVAVFAYAVHTAKGIAARVWPDPVPDEPAVGAIELPADIEARAQQESEGWAQEEVRVVARERYVALRDTKLTEAAKWNLVRKAVGLGTVG